MAEQRYDVLVLGAGAAGCALAGRLSESSDCSVCLVEAGRVLDERCRVLGFDNLYVVDASAIPEIPSANTNLTTVALAERASEWL